MFTSSPQPLWAKICGPLQGASQRHPVTDVYCDANCLAVGGLALLRDDALSHFGINEKRYRATGVSVPLIPGVHNRQDANVTSRRNRARAGQERPIPRDMIVLRGRARASRAGPFLGSVGQGRGFDARTIDARPPRNRKIARP